MTELPTLDIKSKQVFNEKFIPFILNKPETRKPLLVLEGGRASGKSDAAVQREIIQTYRKRKRVLFLRKVERSIRDSQWKLLKDYTFQWHLDDYFKCLSSPLTCRVVNDSEFLCKGFDSDEKIKSIANIDTVIVEEATELTAEEFEILEYSIRGKNNRQIILLFNRKLGNWTEERFFYKNGQFKENEDIYHLHTTYLDNKFLSDNDIRRFEKLKIEDPKKYKKIAEGMPVLLEGLVYTNWDIVKSFPGDCREIVYGLDFGYTDPKALVRCGRIGKDLWLQEIIYGEKIVREEFLKMLTVCMPDRYGEIIADSEDPEAIEVIRRAGWNIKGVEKPKGSVIFGIETLQAFNIHIVEGATNVIKDFENYSWPPYREGAILKKEIEPMHAFSHAPRAVEYAVRTQFGHPHLTENDMKDISFSELDSISAFRGY